MWFISYWFWPVFSAVVWLAMLVIMLSVWAAEGSPRYSSMDARQSIPYISDIGAQGLKPLFIVMSTVTVVSLDLSFFFERWLRHTGRLTPNTSIWQKVESIISVFASIVGAAGLVLLTIFDTVHHNTLHNVFLAVFIGGYIISAIFICWQYQRLGIHYRQSSILRYSFWIKLFFILAEIALAIAFGALGRIHHYNAAAILEWIIAFVFFFYVLSFFIDFLPAVRTKNYQSRDTEMDVALEHGDGAANGERYFRGAPAAADETANGFVDGYVAGNDMHPGYPNDNKPVVPVAPSQNF